LQQLREHWRGEGSGYLALAFIHNVTYRTTCVAPAAGSAKRTYKTTLCKVAYGGGMCFFLARLGVFAFSANTVTGKSTCSHRHCMRLGRAGKDYLKTENLKNVLNCFLRRVLYLHNYFFYQK